ncbi:MAG: hypothetical protein K0Q53_684 [Massilibacillus sp.]|jgi:uncharacterized protein YaaR (DUF327 family)|nr:hypothetical protein [Massilibacillus sp.]
MKISNMSPRSSFLIGEHDNNTTVGKKDDQFSTELKRNQDEFSTEHLNDLLDKIDEQGAKLTETPTYSELKNYRELVKSFIGEAVSRMYTMQTKSGWDRQGRQKVYTTVKNVDKNLSDMAEDIRLGQATKLNIVAKQDAIRGMLVDLYM